MGVESLSRDIGNLATSGLVPTSSGTLELNMPVKFDQQVTQVLGTPGSAFSTNTTTGTFLQGQLTGGLEVTYVSTAVTPGSIATRSAAQMFADMNAQVGQTYMLNIINLSASANTLTVTPGAGVTLNGTMTVPQNTDRVFQVQFTSPTTLTIQSMYSTTVAA